MGKVLGVRDAGCGMRDTSLRAKQGRARLQVSGSGVRCQGCGSRDARYLIRDGNWAVRADSVPVGGAAGSQPQATATIVGPRPAQSRFPSILARAGTSPSRKSILKAKSGRLRSPIQVQPVLTAESDGAGCESRVAGYASARSAVGGIFEASPSDLTALGPLPSALRCPPPSCSSARTRLASA